MRRAIVLAALVLCCAQATTARAQQTVSEAAQAMVGNWEFSNADRDKRCTLSFRTDPSAVGMKVEFDKGCVALFPFVKDVAGWSIAEHDFLRLLDAKGKSVLEFSEVEQALFEAPRPDEGILFIQSVAAAGPAPRTPEQMAGDWTFMRGDSKPLCAVTLMTAPAGGDLALRVKPGCAAAIAGFAPNAWTMDRGELVLKGARDATWRFGVGDDETTWQRVPDGPDPLLLVKK